MASNPFTPPVRRRGAFLYADQALALGPPSIGSQEASTLQELFAYPWTLQFIRERTDTRIVGTRRFEGGEWRPQGLYEVADDAQHLALAFDQSARPVIAWEAQGCTVRYWDEAQRGYQTRSFSGVNPVLINDVLAHYRLEESDVVLLPYQLELLLSREAESVALRGELYPVAAREVEAVHVDAPSAGRYQLTVLFLQGDTEEAVARVNSPSGGLYSEPIIVRSGADVGRAQLAPPASGRYLAAKLEAGDEDGAAAELSAPQSATYRRAAIPYTEPAQGATCTLSGPSGGTYEAV